MDRVGGKGEGGATRGRMGDERCMRERGRGEREREAEGTAAWKRVPG